MPSPVLHRAPPATAAPARTRRPVNFRSISLGLIGVCFIASLTAYNNYAMNNTDFVGNFLPLGLVLFFVTFILAVNGPLSRWKPRWAMARGELAVALGMVLVSCAIPGSGLMRYLPASLISPYWDAGGKADYRSLLDRLNLPDWMLPTMQAHDAAHRAMDPVVQNFFGRAPTEHGTLIEHIRAVPWSAWLRPAGMWAIVIGAFFGAILCGAVIFRRQWVENERLPFPLAGIYLSLIEPPAPGKWLNRLLSARSFWLAAGFVFFIHGLNALHVYSPQNWPEMPIHFDLVKLLSEPPMVYTELAFRNQTIQFTIVGVCYFIQSNVAFSLWVFFVFLNIAHVFCAIHGTAITDGMRRDQVFGATVPFALSILWIGRHHLATVGRSMIARRRQRDPADPYLSYPLAGWGFVACVAVMALWLFAAGVTIAGTVVLITTLMMVFLVIARIIAETGLVFALLPVQLSRPWVYLAYDMPKALTARTTMKSMYLTNLFNCMLSFDIREALPVYATHALRIADGPQPSEADPESPGRRLLPALVLALIVAYVVGGAAYLVTDYAYASSLDQLHQTPINNDTVVLHVPMRVMQPTLDYLPSAAVTDQHSRLGHFAFAAALAAALSILRLRYAWWPFHPVGFLLMYSWSTSQIWFSIFVGWLIKVLLVRFGGSGLYRKAAPFFIGLMVGETGAAAFWVIVGLLVHAAGYEYHAIRVLP